MTFPHPAVERVPLLALGPLLMAREVDGLPHGEDWIYEFHWGGERVRAFKQDAAVQLLTRDGRDVTNRFPRVAAAVAKLRFGVAILDGEVLYLESYPPPVQRFLAQAVDEVGGGVALLAFDLLCQEGKDVRPYSLFCRRLLLASAVQGTPIILSPLIEGNSEVALASAARLGFRGVVAKRAGSPYRPNSLSTEWRKTTFAPLAPEQLRRLATRQPFQAGVAHSERPPDLATATGASAAPFSR